MKNAIVHLDPNNITQRTIEEARGAFVIVCDDLQLRAQIIKEMRVIPLRSDDDLTSIAAARAANANGKVTAVVINHNYGQWIEQALDSLLAQTRVPDEIIVVDDASTDDSVSKVERYIENQMDGVETRFYFLQHAKNSGTAGASRNTGIGTATGEFIVTLDSDDMLAPTYIATCIAAIEKDRAVGVVYTGVQTLIEETGKRQVIPGWPIPFDWSWMTERKSPPNNCIPTASMFRREMWVRAGGYDEGIRNGEDAEFWVRALGAGYRAVKCTPEPLFIYRRHGASMSARPLNDIGAWNNNYKGFKPLAAPTGQDPVQRDYTHPVVSVVIPVGPGHAQHMRTAVQSVLAQTLQNIEVVIINDTGKPINTEAYPFATVCNANGAEKLGVSRARNLGVEVASAPLVYFLDADDLIVPICLQKLCAVYALGDSGYVYSGWQYMIGDEVKQSNPARPYDRMEWLNPDNEGPHAIGVLMSKVHFSEVGGFDTSIAHFEDWEFWARCAVQGKCGTAVPEPLLIYRRDTGERREDSQKNRAGVAQLIAEKFGAYYTRQEALMACCGAQIDARQAAREAEKQIVFIDTGDVIETDGGKKVLMLYTGEEYAPTGPFYGMYQGGRMLGPQEIWKGDIPRMEQTGVWALMRNPPPHVPMSTNADTISE